MDSLMFTFSADQSSMQFCLGQKHADSTSKSFRRRPSSSKTSHYEKSKISSSNRNQLFENCQMQNSAQEQSPEKSMQNIRVKNSSIQMQQKRKLRNIIDTMLGKNFDSTQNHKFDSIVISNRKNINKHRSYLNNNKSDEQKSSLLHDTSSKQNHLNSQNIVTRSHFNLDDPFLNDKKISPKLKLKKFQFANIKINKMNNHSQRYPDMVKDQESEMIERKMVNVSRDSIDRESLGKKVARSKTPKIMYPQSDSKLPSVFRNPHLRHSMGESLKKRTRLLSANFISESGKQKGDDAIYLLQKKKTLENPPLLDASLRQKFRPQSTMLDSKRYSTASDRNEQNFSNLYHPKRLIFDCNQDLNEGIAKKLGTVQVQNNRNTTLRVSTRAKSTHVNSVHRKLREINALVNEVTLGQKQQKGYVKNESLHSRDTAEASDFQESTDRTIPNSSDKLTKSIEEKDVHLINGLGCCVTFQVQKE